MEEEKISSSPKKKRKKTLIIIGVLFLVFVIFVLIQTCYILLPFNMRYSETFTVEDWAFGKAPEKVTIRGISIPLNRCEAYEVARQVWSYGGERECDRLGSKINNFESYCDMYMPGISYEECRRRIKEKEPKPVPVYEGWDIYCDSGLHGMSPSVVGIDEENRIVTISPGM